MVNEYQGTDKESICGAELCLSESSFNNVRNIIQELFKFSNRNKLLFTQPDIDPVPFPLRHKFLTAIKINCEIAVCGNVQDYHRPRVTARRTSYVEAISWI